MNNSNQVTTTNKQNIQAKTIKFRIVLYETENASNLGAIIRTAACCGADLVIIEPISFDFSDHKLKRAQMDYSVPIFRYLNFHSFLQDHQDYYKILLTPHSSLNFFDLILDDNKKYLLFFGRESNGVETSIAVQMDCLVSLPMIPNARSLNLACSAGICANYFFNYL